MRRIRLPRMNAKKKVKPESFWEAANVKAEVEAVRIPFESIEVEFEQRKAKTRQVKTEKKASDFILDSDRVRIYSIVFAKCKLSISELKTAFRQMDKSVLNEDLLELLQALVPTPEDSRILSKFVCKMFDLDEDVSLEKLFTLPQGPEILEKFQLRLKEEKISKTEKFLFELLMIRDIRDMIYFLILMEHFEKMFEMLKNSSSS